MEHVRIDEGVSRSQVSASWPQRKPPIAGKLGPHFDATPVLERYLHGEEIADIAAEYGVHPKALNYHLLKDSIREQWRQAQVAVSLAEYQESKQVCREAADPLSLARAREVMRSCQWDLERLENRLFGQKQEVNVTVDIGTAIQRISERMRAVAEQQTSEKIIESSSEQAEPLHINELDDNLS